MAFSGWLRAVAALVFALVASVGARAQDSEAACESYSDIPVSIETVFSDPYVVGSTTLHELQSLAGQAHAIREGWTMGLTTYKPVIEISFPVTLVQTDGGLACAVVNKLDVRLGYRDVTVYVAREIPRNTCGFDEVFRHEMRHVEVNRSMLQSYLPIVSGRLREHLKLNGVIRQENPDYAVSELRGRLKQIVEETMREMDRENVERQLAIDSREEYARISNACGGQLQSALGHFLRANSR